MRIIDAHLHLFPNDTPRAEELARAAGHHNSTEHLRQVYGQLNIVHGVVMGNRSADPAYHDYPADLFHYCLGMDSALMENFSDTTLAQVEENLRRKSCCGIKLYPGYSKLPLSDRFYEPVYRLSARYNKPVAVHTGLTSQPQAHLKYCHPLALDEVAADHPDTQFVMCHFGNPFLDCAAAVLAKNPNVAADVSGILESPLDLQEYLTEQGGYVSLLRTWLAAANCWDRLLFGTDWPIVNLGDYIRFICHLVPEKHWDAVFFENANRIYGLGC